ncbi:kinase-like domain-containing protein [Xylaria arbuscula]|nr:kinase-like domain-containing protein [Xylaria arbuscula]
MARGQAETLGQTIQRHFETSTYWEFEKSLGNGGYSLAILLRQKAGFGSDGRRIALKVALPREAQSLRDEINWLKQLHGSKHIVRILASCDDATQPDWESNPGILEEKPLPAQTAFNSLTQLEGPVVALEYIENGDLLSLFYRIMDEDVHMPNRMIWSLFLCLIRACIGMAYPIGSSLDTEPILETMPRDSKPPRGITHNDIALRNIMLGEPDDLPEHRIGHIYKLIDFGLTGELSVPASAPGRNLFAIAQIVGYMIKMADLNMRTTQLHKGFETFGGEFLRQSWGNPYPWLDKDLAELIAECLYEDSAHRPSLQTALMRASDAVMNKRPRDFRNPREENDDAIDSFVQRSVSVRPVVP